jgi:hypothetical protein
MGIICDAVSRTKLNSDEIIENINRLFQGMLIRQFGIDQITEKVKSRVRGGQIADIEGWKTFLNDEIYNSQYGQTSRALVNEAMQDAQTNYGDQTLPLLSLLFLANSDKENFVSAFKAVNLAKRTKDTGSDIMNVVNTGMTGGLLAGIAQGIGVIKNVTGTVQQAINPSLIRKDDLKRLTSYHVNFLTLLPVNILANYNEGLPMKRYFIQVLNNSFNKNVQNNFVESTLFSKYNEQEEINVDQFFGENYSVLKNDNELRKGLVNNYINNLSPAEVIQIISGEFKNN